MRPRFACWTSDAAKTSPELDSIEFGATASLDPLSIIPDHRRNWRVTSRRIENEGGSIDAPLSQPDGMETNCLEFGKFYRNWIRASV